MTVSDLIRYLEKLPKDTVIGVVFSIHSDYEILDEQDMTFIGKEERDSGNELSMRYVLRAGRIMEFDKRTWPKEEVPNFVYVLVLPGN